MNKALLALAAASLLAVGCSKPSKNAVFGKPFTPQGAVLTGIGNKRFVHVTEQPISCDEVFRTLQKGERGMSFTIDWTDGAVTKVDAGSTVAFKNNDEANGMTVEYGSKGTITTLQTVPRGGKAKLKLDVDGKTPANAWAGEVTVDVCH